jgi:hypothetical protein
MADFRKWIPALAVLVLVSGLIPTASAQVTPGAMTCSSAAAVPPALRAEGLTELVGDIVLNCTGGTPLAAGTDPIPTTSLANVTVFLNTNVTSRSGIEPVLLIDEPGSGLTGAPPVAVFCTDTAGIHGSGNANCPVDSNAFKGNVSGNSVTWLGVPINPPGTAGVRVFRISNVRANANLVPPGNPGQVLALISISGATSVPINPAQQIVGLVQDGVSFSVGTAADDGDLDAAGFSFLQCESQDLTSFATLRFAEGFATSFKLLGSSTQTQLGTIYNTESDLTVNGTNSSISGLANSASRLKATFNGVPAGVTIYVGLRNYANGATPPATSVMLTSSETGGFFAVPATTTATPVFGGTYDVWAVPLVNGTGTAVWEVTTSSGLSVDSVDIPMFVTYTASPSTNSPTPTPPTVTVNGGFAPTPPAFSASDGAVTSTSLPIPRFADVSDQDNAFTVSVCQTNILFPFVTNMLGFDTGLAIANTSTDPFGTTPQTGTCTLSFYGENKPANITTGVVDSNKIYTALASAVAPNFQGYVIAQCNFQYGHGFAFISDFGARNLAMGYLALIIDDRGGVGAAEALDQ